MRTLVKDYSFIDGSRSIAVPGNPFEASDIRLIVNETKKIVITSSMLKDNIISVVNGVITYKSTLDALSIGDILTIEIDYGYLGAEAMVNDVAVGKAKIVSAINDRGGVAAANDSFDLLASEIRGAMMPTVNVTPISNYPSMWHDLFEVMAANYDPDMPYMYALLFFNTVPDAYLATLLDGQAQVTSPIESGKLTRYKIFKSSQSSGFGWAYSATSFNPHGIGVAFYNASFQGISFTDCRLQFMFFNEAYPAFDIVATTSQFQNTYIAYLQLPLLNSVTIGVNNWFYGARVTSFILQSNQLNLTISGAYTWYTCTSLTQFILPQSLTSLAIAGTSTWSGCASLTQFILPQSLTSLTISSAYTWHTCTSLTQFILPQSLTSLTIAGVGTWLGCTLLVFVFIPMPTAYFSFTATSQFNGCTSLVKIELGENFNWPINLYTATALTRQNIVDFIFAKLKDNTVQTAKTITLSSRYSSTGADPLTAAQLLVATSKNWTVAFA